MIRVLIYNEFVHEQCEEEVKKIYPLGIQGALKEALQDSDISVSTVTLDTVNTITKEVLDNTDVMLWWGHMCHEKVPDEVAVLVQEAVQKGMGIVFLHSAHMSKPFRLLMGTPCTLGWRDDADRELVWVCNPAHPIAQGIGRFLVVDNEETYSEPFAIPEPDELVFIGSYEGGEVFRAGCCYQRGNGKIFYFQPGHETYPVYYNPDVIRVIRNAICWAKPLVRSEKLDCPFIKKPLE